MTKRQKQTLAAMAVVMVLILGAVVFSFYQRDYNRNMTNFQAQLDAQKFENDLKATNIAVNH